MLVSRTWQSAMQPLLWTRVPLVDEQTFTEDPILFPHPDAVLHNIYRVLSLDLSRVADTACLQALAPLLQNQLSELSVAHYSTDVDQILSQNRASLRSFTCSSSRLSHQMQQQIAGFQSFLPRHEATAFWTRMTSLERLDSLDLTATTVYDEHLEIFFTICRRLRSLSLKRGSIVSMHPPTKEPFHKMRRLELSGIANAVHSQLQFITQCPNLEHLAWTSTQATPLIALLVHITTQPELELRQITSIDFTDSLMSDKDLATILSCLPNLRRLIVPWSLFGELCCEQLVNFLADTIEELDLNGCPAMTQDLTQLILILCNQLKQFRASTFSPSVMVLPQSEIPSKYQLKHFRIDRPKFMLPGEFQERRGAFRSGRLTLHSGRTPAPKRPLSAPRPPQRRTAVLSRLNPAFGSPLSPQLRPTGAPGDGDDDNGYTDSDSDSLSRNEPTMVLETPQQEWTWACLGLQELELTLCPFGDRKEEVINVFFDQLALLTELRKLVLSCHSIVCDGLSEVALDLTLGGGLGKLRTLTKLRAFDVREVNPLSWMVEDVRWMGEHWKSLRRLHWDMLEDKDEEARIQELLRSEYPGVIFSSMNK